VWAASMKVIDSAAALLACGPIGEGVPRLTTFWQCSGAEPTQAARRADRAQTTQSESCRREEVALEGWARSLSARRRVAVAKRNGRSVGPAADTFTTRSTERCCAHSKSYDSCRG